MDPDLGLIWVQTVCKNDFLNHKQMTKQTTIVVIGALRVKLVYNLIEQLRGCHNLISSRMFLQAFCCVMVHLPIKSHSYNDDCNFTCQQILICRLDYNFFKNGEING